MSDISIRHRKSLRQPYLNTVPATASKIVCFVTWRDNAQLTTPDLPTLPDHAKPILHHDEDKED